MIGSWFRTKRQITRTTCATKFWMHIARVHEAETVLIHFPLDLLINEHNNWTGELLECPLIKLIIPLIISRLLPQRQLSHLNILLRGFFSVSSPWCKLWYEANNLKSNHIKAIKLLDTECCSKGKKHHRYGNDHLWIWHLSLKKE